MKRYALLLLVSCVCLMARSQDNPNNQVKPGDKFFFGLNYSYLNTEMRLLLLTKHSVWDGVDLGTKDVSQDEIDSINAYMDYTESLHDLYLSAGMVFLDKPATHWYIDGRISVGYARRVNKILNTDNDSADIETKSVHFSPTFGLGFNFRYSFTDKWKVKLSTNTLYVFGKVDKIDENIYPVVEVMDETRENSFHLSYTWFDLLASYTLKKVTIEAGPGFYLLRNWNEYNIVRVDMADGSTYKDNIKTSTGSEHFINGTIQIGWRISDHILIDAGAGISQDLTVKAGLTYFL